ncbi:MAG: ATP synthase F0 subunit C [Candidatus Omnitrophica bacterium]|nr:ATP synthase F0 subunit C [Candidatus Omnitrophota bacterium]
MEQATNWLGLTLPLGFAMAAFGAAFGLGKAVASAMDAMGRQPEAAPRIQLAMIIGCALIEAIAIYGLVVVFVLGSKV